MKYSVTRREVLAVMWGVRKFAHLFVGRTRILTEHKALVTWLERSSGDPLLDRWNFILLEYDIEIDYIEGGSNVPDTITRIDAQRIT